MGPEVNVEIFQHALWIGMLFVFGVAVVIEGAAKRREQRWAEKCRRVALRKIGGES